MALEYFFHYIFNSTSDINLPFIFQKAANLRMHQNPGNQSVVSSRINKYFGSQFIPASCGTSTGSFSTAPTSSTATQSSTSIQPGSSTEPKVGKFKPNLAKLRKAAEQRQQTSAVQQVCSLCF